MKFFKKKHEKEEINQEDEKTSQDESIGKIEAIETEILKETGMKKSKKQMKEQELPAREKTRILKIKRKKYKLPDAENEFDYIKDYEDQMNQIGEMLFFNVNFKKFGEDIPVGAGMQFDGTYFSTFEVAPVNIGAMDVDEIIRAFELYNASLMSYKKPFSILTTNEKNNYEGQINHINGLVEKWRNNKIAFREIIREKLKLIDAEENMRISFYLTVYAENREELEQNMHQFYNSFSNGGFSLFLLSMNELLDLDRKLNNFEN